MSIPEERIKRLTLLAKEAARNGELNRSREYVQRARRIAERHRCGLPRELTRFACDRCDVYRRPGVNSRVRLQEGSHVVIRCECGATARYPYK